jgi:serine protease Do
MNKWLLIIFVLLLNINSWAEDNEFDGVVLLPEIIRSAEKKISPSIVTIEGFGGLLDSSIKGEGKFKKSVQGFSKPGEGPTTGVIIDKEGYIITSTFNFVNEPKIITITLKNGKKYSGKMLGRDYTRKICILKINLVDEVLTVPTFIPSKEIRVGQWAISIGVGFGGIENSVSLGLISGKNRIFGKAIQTDANISPANYGGALIDIEGRIIGICTPLSPNSGELVAGAEWYDSGIGFVIPVADIQDIIEKLKIKKDIQIGKAGFHPRVDPKLPNVVFVDLVLPGTPAEKAGLLSGDKIISIESLPIEGAMKMQQILGRFESGKTISIELQRGTERKIITLTLGEDTEVYKLPKEEKKKDAEEE